MSNIIDSIQLSGTVYTIQGTGGGGSPTVELTQAEYDALVSAGTVSANTYYIITDATPIDLSPYWTSAQTQSAITEATSGKVNTSSVVSYVTSASTDNEIPTAKAVFDAIPSATTYSAGRGIDITNDTISFSLPISAGTGAGSIVEGDGTIANGNSSHAEGSFTAAIGASSHAEGSMTTASGYSHAEGIFTVAIGASSHAEGYYTSALTQSSHAEGNFTQTTNKYEHASGNYNISVSASTTFGDSGNTLFSVGNGTNYARHNAFEIRQNGDIYLTKDGVDIKLQDNLGGTASSAITSGDTNAVAGGAVYDKFDEVEQVTARALVDVNDRLETKLDASAYTPTDLSEYWTSAQTNSAITQAVSGKVNTSTYTAYTAATDSRIGGIESEMYLKVDRITNNTDASDVSLSYYGNDAFLDSVTLFTIGSGLTMDWSDNTYVLSATGGSSTVSSAITSGDTNAVAGGAVYDKFDEVEQVTARALNELAEANEVVARALNDLNDRITAIEEVVARALNDLNDRITALENA